MEGEKFFWVNPEKVVTIPAKDPVPNNPTSCAFTKWDKPLKQRFTAEETVITALYQCYPDIIPGKGSEHPKDYKLVTLDPTDKGTLEGEHNFWVNPNKTVTIPAGKVTPKSDATPFEKWDQSLTQQFNKDTTITAQYKAYPDIIPGKGSEHPKTYVLVTLDPTDKGTLEGEHDFWVNPDVEVTIPAGKVTPKKADEPFARWDKPLKGKFTDNTTITGLYGNEAHITPQTGIDGNMLMTVGAGATATISGLAGAAYVAMKNRKKH